MKFKPNPRQVLYLWKLLVSDEGIPLGQVKPATAAERNELEKNGLIDVSPKTKTPKGGYTKYVTLSEHGWLWASENIDAEISRSQEAAMVLHQVFCKLKGFLKNNENMALARLFAPKILSDINPLEPAEKSNTQERQPENLEDIIREAYYQLSGGKWNFRVRLYDLRQSLASVPRSELDTKLLSMQKEKKLVIYKLDDPSEITPEDDHASIDILGTKKHIVYMEG
ncbi:hypothetical protein QUF72_04885 [Desulfobacterales bacterium HSG2]|nr:hypothetical protein [Desulfobacterales bacterium HSG2]